MAKRLLSMVLSLALLLSCVSGIALFTTADASEPYAFFDVTSGDWAYDEAVTFEPLYLNDFTDYAPIESIGSTGEVGLRPSIAGVGFNWFGEFFAALPAEQGATFAIEYYLDGAVEGDAFTYKLGDPCEPVNVAASTLKVNESAVLFVTVTAEDIAVITENGDMACVYLYFTGEAENVYIQAARLVDTNCAAVGAEWEEAFHAYMLSNELNLKLENEKTASVYENGYTGDTVCGFCGDTLEAGEDIPATDTSNLPRPYSYMTTEGGVLTANRVLGANSNDDRNLGSTDVVQIPGTEEYGIRLNADWNGFWFGGELFKGISPEQSVTMVVEYYIDAEFVATDRHQFFRYQPYAEWQGGNGNGNKWKDMFVDDEGLLSKKNGVFFYTYTAEDRAILGENDLRIQFLGCSAGAGIVYIKSIRLVDTQYVHPVEKEAYSYVNLNGHLLCDYYPDITPVVGNNANAALKEVSPTFGGYQYINLYGDVCAADRFTNKPVLIKVYANEGYENSLVHINSYEVSKNGSQSHFSGELGIAAPSIQMSNGVGTVLLDACFNNSLNSVGSLRIEADEASKISRIEIYDVSTFCRNAEAKAEDIAFMHAMQVANNRFVEKIGYEPATETTPGYTGDVKCTLCGDMITEGTPIPPIDPNRVLASLDTATGALAIDGCTITSQNGVTAGNTDVVAIGETGEYGIKLPSDWAGFNLNGISLDGMTNVVMLIEYYIDMEWTEDLQMFRYKVNNSTPVDLFAKKNNLVSRESALLYHVFSEDEIASIGAGTFTFSIMGCSAGSNVTYIQSVKLVSTKQLNLETEKGYIYTEFEKKPLTGLYPDIMTIPSYGLTFADLEQHDDHPDREWLYRYFIVGGSALSVAGKNTPMYIKLYAKEGFENDVITIGAIEKTAGVFGEGVTVQMVEGEGAVLLPYTCFTNGLNSSGSLRMWWEEAEKLARIEIMDVSAYCRRDDADPDLVDEFHAAFLADRVNVTVVGKLDPSEDAPGYTGDIYCAACDEELAKGNDIPKLEPSDLPDPFAFFDTANGSLRTNGLTLVNQGVEPIPLPIGGTGEYGIKLTGDWQGFRMEGLRLPEGKDVTMVIEYYVDSDLPNSMQLFRYQAYDGMPGVMTPEGDNHYDDIFSDQDSIASRQSGLLFYHFDEAAKEAIDNDDGEFIFRILGCGPGANIVYIQSARLIETKYIASGVDLGYDYISFEEAPLCEYYPMILGAQSSGISYTQTTEGVHPDTQETIHFVYFKVTNSLVGEGQNFRPVVIRFTFKEDNVIERFDWSYQGAPKDPISSEWSHFSSEVVDGVVERVVEEAHFANQLNDLGSFRIPNYGALNVLDNLAMVEVIALTDTSELKALVGGVEDAIVGKTPASAAAYRAAVAAEAALLENIWVTEEEVAAAIARLEAAAALMVDCAHPGETKTVGFVPLKDHMVPGYSGDIYCKECNELIESGSVIEKHNVIQKDPTEPSCEKPGNTGDWWCLDCNELARPGESIMELPHTWGEGVVTKPATKDEKGIITSTCTVCKKATKTTRFEFEPALGDVDLSGKVDSTDARLVLQFAVKKIAPTALNLEVADVDGNGRVDSTDARLILQHSVKKITKFPAEQG